MHHSKENEDVCSVHSERRERINEDMKGMRTESVSEEAITRGLIEWRSFRESVMR